MEGNWILCMFTSKQTNKTEIQLSRMQHWIVCYNILRYRVGQKQLDDLHLAPCRHLCRWCGETHITGQSGLKPSVIMQRWSEGYRAFAVEMFF